MRLRTAAVVVFCGGFSLLAACNGGGGGPPTMPQPKPASETKSTTFGSNPSTVTFSQDAAGVSGSVSFPATASGTANVSVTLQSTLPSGVPKPQFITASRGRRAQNLGANVTVLTYITVDPTGNVSFNASPGFAFAFPPGTLAGSVYLAFYDPNNPTAGWNVVSGPLAGNGTTVDFVQTQLQTTLALPGGMTYVYAIVQNATPLSQGAGTVLAGPTAGPDGGWSPTAVANALQFPVQSGWDGTGETVGIVIDSDVSRTDLTTYLNYMQVPTTARTVTTESVDGGTGVNAGGSQGEATLDVETVAGLAPGANIIIYEIPSLSDQYINDAYNQAISDGKAMVVNSSFGGCEGGSVGSPGYYDQAADTIFATGAGKGIAFVASSGDTGNQCSAGVVGVGFPASDPNVIGVGGTETNPPTYGLTSNTVWNDTSCGSQCGGGGGVSGEWAIPAFQNGLAGVSSATDRNVPDLSMPAEDTDNYTAGSWSPSNGTSWAAPQMSALMAEVYQYCQTSLANPVKMPYDVFASTPAAFVDVTQGNDQMGTSTPYYAAGTGYDDASGIGVPLGMPFANAICPNRVAPGILRAQTFTSFVTHRPAAAFSVDVTPRIRGLIDQGARSAGAPTRIQIVLRPTATLASDEAGVVYTLQRAGFTIVKTFSDHVVVDATAPSGVVAAYFNTEMHDVVQSGYGVRYMPMTSVTIPSALAPYVAGVNLDDVVTRFIPPGLRR